MSLTLDEILRSFGRSERPPLVEDSIGLNTLNGATGSLTKKLCGLFSSEHRKSLRKSMQDNKNPWRRIQNELEIETCALLHEFSSKVHFVSEGLAPVLGGVRGEETDNLCGHQRRKFYSANITEPTLRDYARRIAQAITFMIKLLDIEMRMHCNVIYDEDTLEALNTFNSSTKKAHDILSLILQLLSHDRGIKAVYNREALCLPAVALFVSNTNSFTAAENAQKTISSLKYLCRGCVMLDALRHEGCIKISEITSVSYLSCLIGSTTPFSCLDRLHKGICAFERPTMGRVILEEGNKFFVDGVDLSPNILSSCVGHCYRKSKRILKKLAMGFELPDISTNEQLNECESNEFLSFVLQNERLARKFFTLRPSLKVKKRQAKEFLAKCENLERFALPLLHLLMGGTSRATDYLQLTFKMGDGEDLPSRIQVFGKDLILIVRQSRKTALLHGRAKVCPAVVPQDWFSHILQYWTHIRPFCTILARGLEKEEEEVMRWERYCFVKGSEKQVRRYIERQLSCQSPGGTFQRLRHGAEAIFRRCIVPREHDLLAKYDFDKLFGHSYQTGLSYGVLDLMGSGKGNGAFDISSITRCLKAWWSCLALSTRLEAENSLDDSESESSEESCAEEEVVERDGISPSVVVESSTPTEGYEIQNDQQSSCNISVDSSEVSLFETSMAIESTSPSSEVISELSLSESSNEFSTSNNADIDDHPFRLRAIEDISSINIVANSGFPSIDTSEAKISTARSEQERNNSAEAMDLPFYAIQKLGFKSFRSAAQRILISKMLENDTSIAGILPTGAGKTLTILVSLVEEGTGMTIVVYPLRSVYDDAVHRLKEFTDSNPCYRSAWCVYKQNIPFQNLAAEKKLLLITAEEARDEDFLKRLKTNYSLIRRVIFDEAPLFVTSRFRLGLSSLPLLLRSYLSCPFVLLTGTLQVTQEEQLRESFFSPGLVFIRGPTVRPEIAHRVIRIPRRNVSTNDVVKLIETKTNELTIVFVKGMKKLEEIAEGLEQHTMTRGRVVRYHGSLENIERIRAAQSWKRAEKPIMVATTAFAYGIHDTKCHTVIHVEGAFDVDSYVQGAGRSGRDGRPSNSYVLLGSESFQSNSELSRLFAARRCRMATLSSIMDPEEVCWKGFCGKCDWCMEDCRPQQLVSEAWRSQTFVISNPLVTTTICQERSRASHTVAKIKRNVTRIIKTCQQGFCFSCFAISRGEKRLQHSITACPHWKRRCFRCGSGSCGRSFGTAEKACNDYAEIYKKLTACNACVTCSMPPYILDEQIHKGPCSMGRGCSFRDTVLPCMLLLWHIPKERSAIQQFSSQRMESLDNFLSWALDSTKGLSNFLHFLVENCFR